MTITAQSQDAFFSNILSQSIYDNPTFNSVKEIGQDETRGRISLSYRDQWNRISQGTYSSTLLEADYSFYQSSLDNWNAGIYFLNDVSNSGVLKINGANLVSSYGRKLVDNRDNKATLFLGAGLGYNNTNINTNGLWFGRQYDQSIFEVNTELANGEGNITGDELSYLSIDFGLRLINQFRKVRTEFAIAAVHLNNPTIGDSNNPESIGTRINGFASISLLTNKTITHSFQTRVISQLQSLQVVPTYVLDFSVHSDDNYKLKAGTGLRLVNNIDGIGTESLIVSVGLESKKWSGLISYDINISDLNFHTRGGGAFEIKLAYYIAQRQ